jgi:hypothetical protein
MVETLGMFFIKVWVIVCFTIAAALIILFSLLPIPAIP